MEKIIDSKVLSSREYVGSLSRCGFQLLKSTAPNRSYIASLTSVKLFVKEAIEQGFPYPETITVSWARNVVVEAVGRWRFHLELGCFRVNILQPVIMF